MHLFCLRYVQSTKNTDQETLTYLKKYVSDYGDTFMRYPIGNKTQKYIDHEACIANKFETLRFILSVCKHSGRFVKFDGDKGEDLMSLAVKRGHDKIVEYLLSQGFDFKQSKHNEYDLSRYNGFLQPPGYNKIWNDFFEEMDGCVEVGHDLHDDFSHVITRKALQKNTYISKFGGRYPKRIKNSKPNTEDVATIMQIDHLGNDIWVEAGDHWTGKFGHSFNHANVEIVSNGLVRTIDDVAPGKALCLNFGEGYLEDYFTEKLSQVVSEDTASQHLDVSKLVEEKIQTMKFIEEKKQIMRQVATILTQVKNISKRTAQEIALCREECMLDKLCGVKKRKKNDQQSVEQQEELHLAEQDQDSGGNHAVVDTVLGDLLTEKENMAEENMAAVDPEPIKTTVDVLSQQTKLLIDTISRASIPGVGDGSEKQNVEKANDSLEQAQIHLESVPIEASTVASCSVSDADQVTANNTPEILELLQNYI